MSDKQNLSAAEAWRHAQAAEAIMAHKEGREIPLDADGHIVPSQSAFDQVRREYNIIHPEAINN